MTLMKNFKQSRRRRCGFTLVELMTVMVVIAIVASLTMAGAQYLVRNSRRQRARITCKTLENALARYRHEYKEWPGIPSSYDSDRHSAVVFKGTSNKEVLSPLREENTDNPDHKPNTVHFIDESSLLTASVYDRATTDLSTTAAGTKQPFAYRNPQNGHARFFKVTINLDNDAATVSMDDADNSGIEVIKRDDD